MTLLPTPRFRLPWLVIAALCLTLIGLPGCRKPKATVSGKVTFNGKPLTGGTISFMASPSVMGSSTIGFDGSYTVPDAPVGDVTITVNTPPRPMGPANMPKPPPGMKGMPKEFQPPGFEEGKAVAIVPAPEKYKTMESSPLKYKVERGTQTHDIDLKP